MDTKQIQNNLKDIPYKVRYYQKDQTIFHLMEEADYLGIVLSGYVQAQKMFPNGSQVNVSDRNKGDIIGPAAVFSKDHKYPCDIIALEDSEILLIRKEDMISLMQKDERILQNFAQEISTATYMLQQRLELLSYNGIAQKIAFYLLIRERQTEKNKIRIPGSVSNWAMIMNVSRTSLHRELKKMNDEGIVSYSSPFIIINDINTLQEMLDR